MAQIPAGTLAFVFSNFSWEVRSCGLHGHATYRPDEEALAARLRLESPWGEAWRCLRCGDYVLGPVRGTGPAAHAPVLLRGKALRDAFILRLLAVDKAFRGLIIALVAFAIFRFNGHQSAIQEALNSYLPLLTPLAGQLGIRLQDMAALHLIQEALALPTSTVSLVALGVAGYATLNLVEATGLWLMRRWGEYVAAIGTSAFLPLEIHELTLKITTLRIAALAINLFLVAYLVWSKRLFGVRGGAAAFEAERGNTSLLEVESAATGQRLRRHGGGSDADGPASAPPEPAGGARSASGV